MSAPGTATGPEGAFHHVSVYRTDGTLVTGRTVVTSSGDGDVQLTGLPTGLLRLHVGVSATAGGTETGAVDTTFQGGVAATPITLAMRQAPATVEVFPSLTSLTVGSTVPLYAAAKDGAGEFVYVARSSWQWGSSDTSRATVAANSGSGDASAVATGVAAGGATITAKAGPTGPSSASTLTVVSNGVQKGKWTVMVFMNAANTLYSYAPDNMNQMERIANNPDVRFVVQWKQTASIGQASGQNWSGTRRYLAKYDRTGTVASTVVQDLGSTVDMGSATSLAQFVAWTKAKYPADHYVLVLWSHGAGWTTQRTAAPISRGISYDDQTGHFLAPWDVSDALGGLDKPLDVLAYDACLMQGAEDLFELSDKANYIVGSEENTPGPGYPYDKVFKSIADNGDTTATALATGMVSAYHDNYATGSYSSWALQQSALDTSKITPFRNALESFASALRSHGADIVTDPEDSANPQKPLASAMRYDSKKMDPSDARWWYYDLDQLAQRAASLSGNATVIATANALRTSMTGAGGLVTSTASNANGAHMHGVSIDFSPPARYAIYHTDYERLRMSLLTSWDEFLGSSANP